MSPNRVRFSVQRTRIFYSDLDPQICRTELWIRISPLSKPPPPYCVARLSTYAHPRSDGHCGGSTIKRNSFRLPFFARSHVEVSSETHSLCGQEGQPHLPLRGHNVQVRMLTLSPRHMICFSSDACFFIFNFSSLYMQANAGVCGPRRKHWLFQKRSGNPGETALFSVWN